jgi:hypothetical protein
MMNSNETSGQGYVVQYLKPDNTWTTLSETPKNAKSIAVDNIGFLWVTDLNGNVYSHTGRSDWIHQDGDANEIAMSSNNVVWILNAYG